MELRRKRTMFPTTMLPPPDEVASPMPDMPSSVSIRRKTNDRPAGSGFVTQTLRSVIFIATFAPERDSALCANRSG